MNAVRLTGTGELLDVELGHARQRSQPEPHRRIDVGLGLALRGVAVRELAGRLPLDRPLALQHPGQVAEERDVPERVVAHRPIRIAHPTHRTLVG